MVTGVASDPSGQPLRGTTVRISCAGGGRVVQVSTDSAGRYLGHMSTGDNPFQGSSGSLGCHFREPAQGVARVTIDTTLGFARGPVLLALQFVDLPEH
jgi:hypothetical protein